MIWLLLFMVALLVAAPFWAEARRPRMDQAARANAPGAFIALSRGITHFRWLGPSDGPVVVCVHGLTTPSFVYEPIADRLAREGYRILLYDLYGRGYSDRPKGVQDAAFFITQLEELLESQMVARDITLIGYSMGGAIVSAFAARAPERLRRLILLAPAGMGHELGPVARLVCNHDWLGKWIMMAFYGRSFRQALEAERRAQPNEAGMTDQQMRELDRRGFRAAVLQSMRGLLDHDQAEAHRAIARQGPATLAIWGAEDEVIPMAGKDKLAQWNPEARQRVIPGAGHALAYTHPDEVVQAICDP